jgi:amino acid adenylation domain-containing protein
MRPSEILTKAARLGIKLSVENHQLRYQAPKGALSPDFRRLLAEHRDSIISYLGSSAAGNSDSCPLSHNQQFLWFLYSLMPGSSAYNVAFVARVVSPVDFSRLEAAFQELVDRHPMLRATYDSSSGVPFMRIHGQLKLACEHIAASDWNEETLHREVHRRYCEPFDLENGPIVRLQLFTRAPQDHILLLTIHHIACDGWSIGILLKEFQDLYASFPTKNQAPAAASYPDFIRYQNQMLTGPEGERLLKFWKLQLAGELPVLNLPFTSQRPQIPSMASAGRTHHFSIAGDLYRAIVATARSSGSTLYSYLLAAFQVLLMRYSSQEDILIGTPMAARPRKEDEFTVGCYINPVVLRGRIERALTFEELLRRTRKTVTDAFEHRHYPFPLLVEQLRPVRDPGRSPLFQVMFNFLNRQTLGEVANLLARDMNAAAAEESVTLGDLKMKPFALNQEEGQFDLSLEIIDDDRSLTGLLKYNAELYEEAAIARMAANFKTLLHSIVANPEKHLSDLSLLAPEERHLLLNEWNNTQQVSTPSCIHELFTLQANLTPDAVAVQFADRRMTYSELDFRSSRLAECLKAVGVGPEVLVALYVERSSDMVIALLGILKAGGAYLPLDRVFPRERLQFMLEDACPRVLLTQMSLREELPPHQAEVVCLDSLPESSTAQVPVTPPSPDNLAYVLYTSGSTGRPNGVEIPHRAVVNFLNSMRKAPGINAQDTLLSVTTISFDILGLEIWLPLTTGARVVIASPEAVLAGKQLADTIAGCNATVMQATPATWRLLLESGWEGSSRLKALCGGEAWGPELARPLLSRCASLWNMYGPTETTIWSTIFRVASNQAVNIIGRPIANTEIFILDQNLQPLPVGIPGELYIGGAGLARGYLNRPQLTSARFINHPFIDKPGAKLYRTGDLARYRADGNLEYLGRLDGQVKIRGFRIELGEIGASLMQHPDIRQAEVVAREDGNGDKQLVAYLISKPKRAVSVSGLRHYLKDKLPEYMIPAAFVVLDKFPLTPNGKIDRKALPSPAALRPELESVYLAPGTAVERLVASIWREVLGIDGIGVDDSFFDLGGNSLRMVQVHSRLLEKTTRDLSILELFRYPTIRSLALYLSQEENELPAAEDQLDDTFAAKGNMPSASGSLVRMKESPGNGTEIAIIGMSCRFPGALGIEEYWHNIRNGVESISFFTDQELSSSGIDLDLLRNPNYIKAKGMLQGVDLFDASFFGFTPREAEITDPQQRLFLECAWEALENAGYDPDNYHGLIGVYGGTGQNSYLLNNLLPNRAILESVGEFQVMLGNDKDYAASRVSYKMNLRGPSVVVQTACSTSLVAVSQACQSLLGGECDMALAGASSLNFPQPGGYLHQNGGINSPDGHCRAFDARAQGTVFSNGAGFVVLKRLGEAIADGDTIHAIIKGAAVNNDGSFKIGYTAPSVEGQAKVIRTAHLLAEVDPETITYVEAHGTGTALGDPIEIAGLTQAFRMGTPKNGFCAIGSVKTNIGHTDAAAGIAGLIKTVLMLKNRMIPPSLHFEKPNPEIDFANTPFYVNVKLKEWRADSLPLRAGVSSFGIGGTNAHIIVEEAPLTAEPSSGIRPWQLLLLSARTPAALDKSTVNLVEHLKHSPHLNLADVAYTLQTGRKAFNHRRIAVCQDLPDAVTVLGTLHQGRVVTALQETTKDIVFMFSGQGSQYVDMGFELYQTEPLFREQLDHCAEILQPHLGHDLREIIYPEGKNPEQQARLLAQTWFTQPALFAVEYALAQLWLSWGVTPAAMVGHSIGEYVAACLAGVFSLQEALCLVAARGRLMQELPGGSMLAVPLSEKELLPYLGKLSLAVINPPALCVVSGEKPAVEDLKNQLSNKGLVCRALQTSHAFHSKMMEPVLNAFTKTVESADPKPPRIPFVSNVTGTWITQQEAQDPAYWARHLRQTVRFSDCLRELLKEPARVFLEVGPGQTFKVLINQQPEKTENHIVLSSLRHPKEAVSDSAFILNALGRIWLAGAAINWSAFHANENRHRLPLPTYPFERQRYWIDAGNQKVSMSPATFGASNDVSQERAVQPGTSQNSKKDSLRRETGVEIENTISKIWQEILGVEVKSASAVFFELGGTSLTALRMLSRVEKEFGVRLPLSIFREPTVGQLVTFLTLKNEEVN